MSIVNNINKLIGKITGYKLIRRDLDIHLQLLFDEKYGHKLSRTTCKSVGPNMNPIPWITYPALEYIDQLDLSDKEIFEWGSGNSTKYFSKRCKKITSIETNLDWYNEVKEDIDTNVNLLFVEIGDAAQSINTNDNKYDVIVIDSSTNRHDCAKNSIVHLNDGGIIILDNSDRFQQAAAFLKSQGFIQVDMHGIGPIVKFSTTTTIFFDRKFNFESIQSRQPTLSLGGRNEIAE